MGWDTALCLFTVCVVLLRALVAFPVRVRGESMRDTLKNGQIVLVVRAAALRGAWRRGDVVVCRYPGRASRRRFRLGMRTEIEVRRHTLFIKRLIALPGDTIELREGAVYVNGAPVDETRLRLGSVSTDTLPPRRLGGDAYFVLGDNRAHSNDSRAVGALRRGMLVGRACRVLWPPCAFGKKV